MGKVNEGHYLELMDRLHVIMCTVDDHCIKHPVAKKNKKLKTQLNYALEQLWDAYQMVGELDHKNNS